MTPATSPFDSPVPNPPPHPTDLPAPRLVRPRTALLRSLLVWGWGQVTTGDRRGWLLVPLQPLAIAALVLMSPPLVPGAGVTLVYVAGVALLVAWVGVAVHAYRRAVRRRVLVELPGPDGSAIALLVFAPFAIAASTALWVLGGVAADPATVVDRYVADWRAGRVTLAIARFDERPGTGVLVREIWDAQLTALHNELIRLVPRAGPEGGIDPDRPFDTVRWVDGGPTPGGGHLVRLEVARRETVRGLVLGLLPVSSQRLVPLEQLGSVELVRVPIDLPREAAGVIPAGPWAESWRIRSVEVMGVTLGE